MGGITYDGISSTQIYSTEISGAGFSNTGGVGSIAAGGTFSGGNVYSAGSIINAEGRLHSTSAGSPGQYGAFIQTGSFATGAGSTANVPFRKSFGGADAYIFWAWPQSGPSIAVNGSVHVFTSGATNNGKHTSGANVVGGASIAYDYIAIGL